jgi:hypothetical protein
MNEADITDSLRLFGTAVAPALRPYQPY